MKHFSCLCGGPVFFENSTCGVCGRSLGFDPERMRIHSLESTSDNTFRSLDTGESFRYCSNHDDYALCNWLIPAHEGVPRCRGCGLNRTIPNLGEPINLKRWQELEKAKKRLLYSLYSLDLPVHTPIPFSLVFDFIECESAGTGQPPRFTGHLDGVITLNAAEADHVHLETTRQQLNEPYRTLLGHFRHEIGHFYWAYLTAGEQPLMQFRALFGDERIPYRQALDSYYEQGSISQWSTQYISAYASSHPLEDWAETFAHYLHMQDSMQTAGEFGLLPGYPWSGFEQRLNDWIQLGVAANELNRSMGLPDLYPFVIPPSVRGKLEFIERVIRTQSPKNPA